ncbi:cubilin [Elysia marginata]|uniref:Cubilin n=1 Tax=Elysia marginata TaxID=1093978 RepID=A0AAV4JQV6_9GAST|nr:cubilin [Elysia marginata]
MEINGKGSGGIIRSPNYPKKYPPLTQCEWIIKASTANHKILVQLSDINIEGKYGRKGKRPDCNLAALRLYTNRNATKPKAALCGKVKEDDDEVSFVSDQDTFKITFISSPNSLGDKGFKISWTEIHDSSCPQKASVQILHIAIGTSIASFFCITLLICAFYHRRKFRTDRAPPDHDHVEVRYVSAPTGCNTTDRLLIEDRNDAMLTGSGAAYHEQQQQQQQHHHQYPYNHENHTNGGSHNNMNNTHPAATTTTNSAAAVSAAANTQSPRCQKVSMV